MMSGLVDGLLAAFGGAASGGLSAYRAADETRARRQQALQDDAEEFNRYAFGITREENDAKQFAEQQALRNQIEARNEAARLAREAADEKKAKLEARKQDAKEKADEARAKADQTRADAAMRQAAAAQARVDAILARMAGGGGGDGGGGNSGGAGGSRVSGGNIGDFSAPAEAARLLAEAEGPLELATKARIAARALQLRAEDGTPPDVAPKDTAQFNQLTGLSRRFSDLARIKGDSAAQLLASGTNPTKPVVVSGGVGAAGPATTRLVAETNKRKETYAAILQDPRYSPEERSQALQAIQIIDRALGLGVLKLRLNNASTVQSLMFPGGRK